MPLGNFQAGEGLSCNLRRGSEDSEDLNGVKCQLPPVTPVAFTVDQGIFEDKEQGIRKLMEESDV